MACWFHVWKITEKQVLPSLLEQAAAMERKANFQYTEDPSEKRCIVTSKCEKCGTEKVERI